MTADSKAGPQAWVDAYHDTHQTPAIDSLPLKSGALQGAVVVDYPFDHRFESLHIAYDGVNGQLSNLDLFNTVVSIASGQMGIGVSLQQMWKHTDSYKDRLQTMLRGMMKQGLGHASGPHSSFIPYHVDAVTLQPLGQGWQDEMAMGRVVESTFRSLNNLLEHLHQSFFFYLLMQTNRFVSIGTYLPSAMLIAGNFTIMAIYLWVKSGPPSTVSNAVPANKVGKKDLTSATTAGDPKERELLLPLAVVAGSQFLGVLPLFIFNHTTRNVSRPYQQIGLQLIVFIQMLTAVFLGFAVINSVLPFILSATLTHFFAPTNQQYLLIKSFSLLLLGLYLSSLATLNFSLAFLIGLLATPLTFIYPTPSTTALKFILKAMLALLLTVIAPTAVLVIGSWALGWSIEDVLAEAAYGWDVWGMNTQVVVWCVWWPAWVIGGILLFGKPREKDGQSVAKAAR